MLLFNESKSGSCMAKGFCDLKLDIIGTNGKNSIAVIFKLQTK